MLKSIFVVAILCLAMSSMTSPTCENLFVATKQHFAICLENDWEVNRDWHLVTIDQPNTTKALISTQAFHDTLSIRDYSLAFIQDEKKHHQKVVVMADSLFTMGEWQGHYFSLYVPQINALNTQQKEQFIYGIYLQVQGRAYCINNRCYNKSCDDNATFVWEVLHNMQFEDVDGLPPFSQEDLPPPNDLAQRMLQHIGHSSANDAVQGLYYSEEVMRASLNEMDDIFIRTRIDEMLQKGMWKMITGKWRQESTQTFDKAQKNGKSLKIKWRKVKIDSVVNAPKRSFGGWPVHEVDIYFSRRRKHYKISLDMAIYLNGQWYLHLWQSGEIDVLK